MAKTLIPFEVPQYEQHEGNKVSLRSSVKAYLLNKTLPLLSGPAL